MKRISIKDIASHVGVSYATVSLVLSGKDGRISTKTSERIKEAAKELGYQPNLLAQSLQSGSSKAIGMVVADISNSFFATAVLHTQRQLEKEGYAVLVVNSDEDPVQLDKMVRFLRSRQVDGYIIVPTIGRLDIIEELHNLGMPMVMIDRLYEEQHIASVVADNYIAMYDGAKDLIKKGVKRALYINFDHNQSNFTDREYGFCDGFSGKGREVTVCRIRQKHHKEDIANIFSQMQQKQESYDAMIFASNSIAISSLNIIVHSSYFSSQDIKILTFDQNDLYSMLPVDITYIQQPVEQMATDAAKIILNMIKGDEQHENSVTKLPCRAISNSNSRAVKI